MATVYIPKSLTDLSTSPGSTVANGDDVVFGEGSQTITNGLSSWSGFASLNSVSFDQRFTGTVGGSGFGSLAIDVDAGAKQVVSYAAGGGALFISAAGPSAVIARFKQIGSGAANLTGGTFTRVEQRSGSLSASGTCVVPNFFQSGGNSVFQYIVGTSGFQLARISGGTVFSERGLDSDFSGPVLQISGGDVTIARVDSNSTVPTGTGSTASGVVEVIGPNAKLTWRGGNIDTLRAFGSTLDFSGITQDITITNLFIDAAALNKSTIKGSRFFTVTITNTTVYGADNDTVIP